MPYPSVFVGLGCLPGSLPPPHQHRRRRVIENHMLSSLKGCTTRNFPRGSVGYFPRCQSSRNGQLHCGSPMGSQVLPENLLQRGLPSPGVRRSCQEPAPAWASQAITARASPCSGVGSSRGCRGISVPPAPHGLQGYSYPTRGCREISAPASGAGPALLPHRRWALQEVLPLSLMGSGPPWSRMALASLDTGKASDSFPQKPPLQLSPHPPFPCPPLPQPGPANPIH